MFYYTVSADLYKGGSLQKFARNYVAQVSWGDENGKKLTIAWYVN